MTYLLDTEAISSIADANWNKGIDQLYPTSQIDYDDHDTLDFNFLKTGQVSMPEHFRYVMMRRQTQRLYEMVNGGERGLTKDKMVSVIGQPQDGNSCAALCFLALRICEGKPVVFQAGRRDGEEWAPKSWFIEDGKVEPLFPVGGSVQRLNELVQREDIWVISDGEDPMGKIKGFKGKLLFFTSRRLTSSFTQGLRPRCLYVGGWDLQELFCLKGFTNHGDLGTMSLYLDIFNDFKPPPGAFRLLPSSPHDLATFHDSLSTKIRASVKQTIADDPSVLPKLRLCNMDTSPMHLLEMAPVDDNGFNAVTRLGQDPPYNVAISTRMKLQPRTRFIGSLLAETTKHLDFVQFEVWWKDINNRRYNCKFEWSLCFESMAMDLFNSSKTQTWKSIVTGRVFQVQLAHNLQRIRVEQRMMLQRTIHASCDKPALILPASRHQNTLSGVLIMPEWERAIVVIVSVGYDFTITEYAIDMVSKALPEDLLSPLYVLVVSPHDNPTIRIHPDLESKLNISIHTFLSTIKGPNLISHARNLYLGETV